MKIFLETGNIFGCGIIDAERDSHRGGDADGGCAAHNHVADHIRDLLMRRASYENFFSGQLRLIDEDYAVVGPFEGLNHKFVVGRWSFAIRRSLS